MSQIPHLLTIGRIAAEEGETVRRIQYVLTSRPHIKPIALAGNTRLYNSQSVEQIRAALAEINSRRVNREAVPC
ncbi:MAG: hypothetical protein JWP89_2670 [Schlesneria sp.]|nr:hypothetical protein [Schlesneria sp.]